MFFGSIKEINRLIIISIYSELKEIKVKELQVFTQKSLLRKTNILKTSIFEI